MNHTDNIDFKVLNEETNDFGNPVVYNNLSCPITLTYLNKNVATNFQVRLNGTSIFYDGRLLKSANVDLTKLTASISFEIVINEQYTCKLYISIPYKTETGSVLDGNVLQIVPLNGTAKFYQL